MDLSPSCVSKPLGHIAGKLKPRFFPGFPCLSKQFWTLQVRVQIHVILFPNAIIGNLLTWSVRVCALLCLDRNDLHYWNSADTSWKIQQTCESQWGFSASAHETISAGPHEEERLWLQPDAFHRTPRTTQHASWMAVCSEMTARVHRAPDGAGFDRQLLAAVNGASHVGGVEVAQSVLVHSRLVLSLLLTCLSRSVQCNDRSVCVCMCVKR